MAVCPIFTPDFSLTLIFKIHFEELSYFIFLWSVFFFYTWLFKGKFLIHVPSEFAMYFHKHYLFCHLCTIFLSTFYIFTFLDFFVMKMSNSWQVILHRSTFNCHVRSKWLHSSFDLGCSKWTVHCCIFSQYLI